MRATRGPRPFGSAGANAVAGGGTNCVASMQAVEAETQRLARIYSAYAASAVAQARWDDRNLGNRAMANERRTAMHSLLGRHGFMPLHSATILDVGCGSGK